MTETQMKIKTNRPKSLVILPLLNNNNIKKEILLYKVYKQQFEFSGQCRRCMCVLMQCAYVSVCQGVHMCVSMETEEVMLSWLPEGKRKRERHNKLQGTWKMVQWKRSRWTKKPLHLPLSLLFPPFFWFYDHLPTPFHFISSQWFSRLCACMHSNKESSGKTERRSNNGCDSFLPSLYLLYFYASHRGQRLGSRGGPSSAGAEQRDKEEHKDGG